MGLFGETANERKLREEIEDLRQQLDTAKAEAERAWAAKSDETTLRINQVTEREKKIKELEEEKARIAKSLLNYIKTAKRKKLKAQAQAAKVL